MTPYSLHEDILQRGGTHGCVRMVCHVCDDIAMIMKMTTDQIVFRYLIHSKGSQLLNQMIRGIHCIELSFINQGNPVTERLGFIDIVSGQDDGKPLLIQLSQQIPHLTS